MFAKRTTSTSLKVYLSPSRPGTPKRYNSARSPARRVAVLYQSVEPPVINGVRKPKKPGGYRDSGSDIAYVLRQNDYDVVTESKNVSPEIDDGWCFPDTEEGIVSAIETGATHIWANTVLFASHPLQCSLSLTAYESKVRVIGQPPLLVDEYDDKNIMSALLRRDGRFRLPASRIVDRADGTRIFGVPYPIVGKPIRGRGSHGVKLCHNEAQLSTHLRHLLKESPLAMAEAYLPGEEATVTVMPPSKSRPYYWALPIVARFNHQDGIAPYNGVVAVTQNSRVPSAKELSHDSTYREICQQCEQAAELLRVTAPIRIDVRRVSSEPRAKFAMFDINMKPNMTGPGRPGRENQASLTAIAAERLGWSYADLLGQILDSARSLKYLRSVAL